MRRKNTRRLVKGLVLDLKEVRPYALWITGLFVIAVILGLFIELPLGAKLITGIVEEITQKSDIGLVLGIMWNNMRAALFGIVFGIVFGFFPLFAASVNGLIIGSVLRSSGSLLNIWKLAPHGIFELPAIMIAFALGMKLGLEPRSLKKNALLSLRLYAMVIVPLLVIAGLIEGALFLLAS